MEKLKFRFIFFVKERASVYRFRQVCLKGFLSWSECNFKRLSVAKASKSKLVQRFKAVGPILLNGCLVEKFLFRSIRCKKNKTFQNFS